MAGNAARWRDLPEVLGKWSGVYEQFRRWSHAGVSSAETASTPHGDGRVPSIDASDIARVAAEALLDLGRTSGGGAHMA